MKFKKAVCIILSALLFALPIQASAATYVSDSQIVSASTPTSAEGAELAWSVKLGTSYKNAPSTQIVVGDTLIVMSGKKLLKLDAKTGKTLKSADMVDAPS